VSIISLAVKETQEAEMVPLPVVPPDLMNLTQSRFSVVVDLRLQLSSLKKLLPVFVVSLQSPHLLVLSPQFLIMDQVILVLVFLTCGTLAHRKIPLCGGTRTTVWFIWT
jgi:hypothetical protein